MDFDPTWSVLKQARAELRQAQVNYINMELVDQGVIFPAGVRVFPAGNLQHLTGLTGNFIPNSHIFVASESSVDLD